MTRHDVTPDEFEELFRRHAPEVHRYLLRRAPHEADDLVGDVFVIAWQRRHDLPGADLKRAWLYGVARRLLLAETRKASQQRAASAELSRLGDRGTSEPSNRDVEVRRAVDSLPPADRELIMLTSWERLSVGEVALVLDLRPGTARVRLHRARQRLARNPRMQALIESEIGSSRH